MAHFGEQQCAVFTRQELGTTLFRQPVQAAAPPRTEVSWTETQHPKSLGNKVLACLLEEAAGAKSLSRAPSCLGSPPPMGYVFSLLATELAQWATS